MSWMLYQDAMPVEDIHLTPLYGSVLSAIWHLSDGQVEIFVYTARAISFFLFSTTILTLSYLFKAVFFTNRYEGILYAFILATCFCIYLAAVRGFEIRPEALGNFLYIFGASYLVFGERSEKGRQFSLYIMAIISLCVASFVTIRHSIPSIFLALASTIFLCRGLSGRMILIYLIKTLFIVIAVLAFIDYFLISLDGFAIKLLEWRDPRPRADLHWKFFELGLWKSMKISGAEYLWRLILLSSILMYSAISIVRVRKLDKNTAWVLAMVFAGAVLSVFLLIYEKRPYNYAVSVEGAVYLVLLLIAASRMKCRASKFMVGGICILAALGMPQAVNRLDHYRNTTLAVTAALDKGALLHDATAYSFEYAVSLLSEKKNLSTQIRSRQIVCAGLLSQKVLVENYDTHPICVMDPLSRDWAWLQELSFEEQVSEIRADGALVKIYDTGIGRIAVY